jgi:hypothetical protein
MNENNYHRRGLIKRGLTIIGGIFFLGVGRYSFGAATKPVERNGNAHRASKARGKTQHCIEGVSLGSPIQR